MEKQIDSPRFSLAFAFVMGIVGLAQATTTGHTYQTKPNPRDFLVIFLCFLFRNPTERKSQIPRIINVFACDCFCVDGNRLSDN